MGDERNLMPKTQRGFTIYDEFEDMYGGTVRVQESSNIKGGVWVFYDYKDNGLPHPLHQNGHICGAPHLSEEQAVRLARALLTFVAHETPYQDLLPDREPVQSPPSPPPHTPADDGCRFGP